jgi:hypothetical protein
LLRLREIFGRRKLVGSMTFLLDDPYINLERY